MRFNPVSEEEAQKANLFPKGDYDAVVESSIEKVSKTNNEMIELVLLVYGPEGKERRLKDWLVATDGGQAKIQRFCKSADLWDEYQAGELTAYLCDGANVRVKLGTEPGKDGYPPKNKVADYLPRKTAAEKAAEASPRPATPLRGKTEGVSAQQQHAAGTGRADPTKPPTEDEIPF
jgi:hypothetical protein